MDWAALFIVGDFSAGLSITQETKGEAKEDFILAQDFNEWKSGQIEEQRNWFRRGFFWK
jgi:hypothetical protein